MIIQDLTPAYRDPSTPRLSAVARALADKRGNDKTDRG